MQMTNEKDNTCQTNYRKN